ncbi:hypothetical protein PsW64_03373 [Pseudovibrio sp. W64]|nr:MULTISPECIES: hypothetical protein [unclassified Pseudovibrio]KZK77745.1 hypothetical protein PsW64_03373 [Pseudovibrio sp. W64]KZK88954.1 hypothetical protein PsAD5_05309 [Pseudovibrio sp. Ad5]KZK95621.1 hypothetical protein PsAD46_00631 [Pseudovibrio sp. Ad46]
MVARVIVPIAIAFALTACSSSAGISKKNPDYFGAKEREGSLSGVYNPAGFSSAQVRRLLGTLCQGGQLEGFSEARSDGLVSWKTNCANGIRSGVGFVEFQRIDGSSEIMVETTGSNGSGNLVYTRQKVKL